MHRDHRLVTLFLNLDIVFSDENALFVFLFQPILARLVQTSIVLRILYLLVFGFLCHEGILPIVSMTRQRRSVNHFVAQPVCSRLDPCECASGCCIDSAARWSRLDDGLTYSVSLSLCFSMRLLFNFKKRLIEKTLSPPNGFMDEHGLFDLFQAILASAKTVRDAESLELLS